MSTPLTEAIGEPAARVTFMDAKTFREMMEALGKIVDEARFTITRDGVRVVAMDPGRVALIEINVPAEALAELELAEGREQVEMGVNMERLRNFVKKGKKGDHVVFLVTDDKVLITLESKPVRRYLLPNLEVATEVPEEIRLEFDVEATVMSDVVKKAVKDASVFADVIEFEAGEDYLVMRGRAEGRRGVEVRLTRDSAALLGLEVKAPSTSAYDLSYINNVLSLTKVAEAVDVKFSTDKPLEMVFKSVEGSTVRFLLAPTALS
ncbi:DNA polymerase sliding clamp [Stetteria hydrogenophila]